MNEFLSRPQTQVNRTGRIERERNDEKTFATSIGFEIISIRYQAAETGMAFNGDFDPLSV